MNTLELIRAPLADRIGWVLLHSLWQAAVSGGGFQLARFALRGRSAHLRYLAGCIALTLLGVSLVFTFTLQSPPLAAGGMSPGANSFPVVATDSTPRWVPGSMVGSPRSDIANGTASLLALVAPWLTPFWMLGVFMFSLRLSRSCWWVGKIRRTGNKAVRSDLMEKLDA